MIVTVVVTTVVDVTVSLIVQGVTGDGEGSSNINGGGWLSFTVMSEKVHVIQCKKRTGNELHLPVRRAARLK